MGSRSEIRAKVLVTGLFPVVVACKALLKGDFLVQRTRGLRMVHHHKRVMVVGMCHRASGHVACVTETGARNQIFVESRVAAVTEASSQQALQL